jgi:hypothetical protein
MGGRLAHNAVVTEEQTRIGLRRIAAEIQPLNRRVVALRYNDSHLPIDHTHKKVAVILLRRQAPEECRAGRGHPRDRSLLFILIPKNPVYGGHDEPVDLLI